MGNSYIHKLPSQPITIPSQPSQPIKGHLKNHGSFAQALEKAAGIQSTLTISKHASLRMDQRRINIEPQMWEKIGMRVEEAKQKGVTDSLVLLKNAAMIVSAKNNTVVTVMDRQEAGGQIFTNINGTIVMD